MRQKPEEAKLVRRLVLAASGALCRRVHMRIALYLFRLLALGDMRLLPGQRRVVAEVFMACRLCCLDAHCGRQLRTHCAPSVGTLLSESWRNVFFALRLQISRTVADVEFMHARNRVRECSDSARAFPPKNVA